MRLNSLPGMMSICCVTLLFFAGCEGTTNDVDATGVWSVTTDNGRQGLMTLHQEGTSVSGFFNLFGSASGSVWGIVNGDFVSLTAASLHGSYTIDMPAVVHDNTMNGTYVDSNGNRGSWTATRP